MSSQHQPILYEPPTPVCEGGSGLFFPVGGDWEQSLPRGVKIALYAVALSWCFLGVAIIADAFMRGIETITARTKRVLDTRTGRFKTVKVWNDTVANLTLMALGSSAPEILLNIIELGKNRMYVGALGPSTIVGSAAFNLFCITAVCVLAIPNGETRKIKDVQVYAVTATFSILAYLWLLFILLWNSKDVVSIWEASVTLFLFPVFVCVSYIADRGGFGGEVATANSRRVIAAKMTREELAEIVQEIKEETGDIDEATMTSMVEARTASRPSLAVYRNELLRSKSKSAHTLQSARWGELNRDEFSKTLSFSMTCSGATASGATIVEFTTSCVTIQEPGQEVKLNVIRNGNLHKTANVCYTTRDGTATEGADYLWSAGTLSFAPDVSRQEVALRFLCDGHVETPKSFYVELYLVDEFGSDVKLGPRRVVSVTLEDSRSSASILMQEDSIWMQADSIEFEEEARDLYIVDEFPSDLKLGAFDSLEEEAREVAVRVQVVRTHCSRFNVKSSHSLHAARWDEVNVEMISGESFNLGSPLSRKTLSDVPIVEFATSRMTTRRRGGEVNVKVVRSGNLQKHANVGYRTMDGTALVDQDFLHSEGVLTFLPDITSQEVNVSILAGSGPVTDTHFFMELFLLDEEDPGDVTLGSRGVINITIDEDTRPGVLEFQLSFVEIEEKTHDVTLRVEVVRTQGTCGVVSCRYRTEPGSAIDVFDYEAVDGILVFEDGVASAEIAVVIKARGRYENTEQFKLVLSDPEGCQLKVDNVSEEGLETCECVIEIKADPSYRDAIDRLARSIDFNWDKARLGTQNWKEQFQRALSVISDPDEENRSASWQEWVFHLVVLPWKLWVACIPPTDFCGGWLCFMVSLVYIGVITAGVGDLAELFGCAVGVKEEITAITFVALGTSLPDTFASRTAAQQDPYADASLGNVTGSNSVNVFLGLGLPWTIGSIYWYLQDRTPEWHFRTPSHISDSYDHAVFVVEAGSLVFTVSVFSLGAVFALICLALRRRFCGGELGGPLIPKIATAIFLVLVWLGYIAASVFYTEFIQD